MTAAVAPPVATVADSPGEALRVLMISDVYFPRVNGVSTSVATFRDRCARLGVRIDLLAPDYGRAESREEGVVRVPSRGVWLDPEDRMMGYRALLKCAAAMGPYDLIHVQTPFVAHYAGLRLARQQGIPVIATYHTFFEQYLHHYVPFMPSRGMRAFARRFSRTQCNALDAVVVPSSQMLQTLCDYGVRTPAVVVPTGLDLRRFGAGDGARFRARHGIAAHRPVLLFVGRVAFEKNIGFLIDVLQQVREQVPEVLLLIAGEGPALHALQRRVAKLQLQDNVRFIGYLSRQQDLHDCYSAGDVFVFASRTETQGLVLLEALASGLPMVSTAEMGTRDVLDGVRGALVSPEEVGPFAARVLLLLRDPRLRLRMARAAHGDAQRWSDRIMAQRLIALYTQVVESRVAATAD